MFTDEEAIAAKAQGWIVYWDGFSQQWKRWSGPWRSLERAREIIDRHISPKEPDRRFIIVGATFVDRGNGCFHAEPSYPASPVP